MQDFNRYDTKHTHFHRTDPCPYHTWKDPDEPLWLKVLGGVGFIIAILVLLFVGALR